MDKEIRRYEVSVDGSQLSPLGVDTVSLVDFPAIERDFVALKATKPAEIVERQRLARQVQLADKTRFEVTGPALIPDKQILRYDEEADEFYTIEFSAETIRTIRDKFFRDHHQTRTNSQHTIPLAGNTVVESWIIEDFESDKAKALGLEELPVGTWMLTMKIGDEDWYNDNVLTGEVKGFSIEGYFDHNLKENLNSNITKPMKNEKEKKKGFLNQLTSWMFNHLNEEAQELGIYILEDGTEIDVDDESKIPYVYADGERGEVAADGEYVTADGMTIVVEDGVVTEEREAEEMAEPAELEEEVAEALKAQGIKPEAFQAVLNATNSGLRKKGKAMLSRKKTQLSGDELKEVKAAAFVTEAGEILTVDGGTGRVHKIDEDGWMSDADVGSFTLVTGETLVVIEEEVVYDEGTDWEWGYMETRIDAAASTVEPSAYVPWLAEILTKNQEMKAEVTTLKSQLAKLKKEPAADPAKPPKTNLSETPRSWQRSKLKEKEATVSRFKAAKLKK